MPTELEYIVEGHVTSTAQRETNLTLLYRIALSKREQKKT